MIYRNKYHAMRVTQFVTVLLVLVALQKLLAAGLSGGSVLWPTVLLLGSAAVGLMASISAHYYNVRQDDLAKSQKIALETLAKIGEQRQKDKGDPWQAKR